MAVQDSSQMITGQSLRRALDVLDLFVTSDERSLGVTEIAQRLGLAKAVVHRTLSVFRESGLLLLDENTRRYSLGPQVLLLGQAYLRHLDMRTLAREAMVDLMSTSGETVTLSVRVGWTRVYIDQVTPHRDVKMTVNIGHSYPLHAGASSKALLAFLNEVDRNEYLRTHKLSKLTSNTLTDLPALVAELENIRELGYATSLGERDESAGSIAAPLFGRDGSVLGVVSVCGPKERFARELDSVAEMLLKTVTEINQRLGSSDVLGRGKAAKAR